MTVEAQTSRNPSPLSRDIAESSMEPRASETIENPEAGLAPPA